MCSLMSEYVLYCRTCEYLSAWQFRCRMFYYVLFNVQVSFVLIDLVYCVSTELFYSVCLYIRTNTPLRHVDE
jgi:hypothetical protein